MTGFAGPSLTSYTSFFAHVDEVRDILVHDRGVISLGPQNVRVTHRRGLQRWDIKCLLKLSVAKYRGNGIENLTCMAYSGTSHSEVLAAGGQNQILLLNIDRGSIVKQVFTLGIKVDERNLPRTGIPNFGEEELFVELRLMGVSLSLILESAFPLRTKSKALTLEESKTLTHRIIHY